jgi:folate-binding protein YgfZ
VANWVRKFVITEPIEVDDVTDEFSTLFVVGPEALDWIQSAFAIAGAEGERVGRSSAGEEVIAVPDMLWPTPAYHLLFPTSMGDSFRSIAIREGRTVSQEEFDGLRIGYGIPVAGAEITADVNPLEAGLSQFVSFTKGCYVGQEVIARIDSYKKLQKQLTKFIIEPPVGGGLLPGARVVVGGTEVGIVTSMSHTQPGQATSALGFLRTRVDDEEFTLCADDGKVVATCKVVR